MAAWNRSPPCKSADESSAHNPKFHVLSFEYSRQERGYSVFGGAG